MKYWFLKSEQHQLFRPDAILGAITMSQELKYRIGNTTNDSSDESEACMSIKRKVSKIDRFTLRFAIEVEGTVHSRLSNIINMFLNRSAKLVCQFSMKCKLGSQRHRQDRILNQSKNLTRKHQQSPGSYLSSDRLFYGEGAQLVHELLNQPLPFKTPPKHTKRRKPSHEANSLVPPLPTSDLFEPSLYAQKIEEMIRNEIRRSELIMNKLDTVQNTLRYLASNHRNQVDSVYSAVEERQASVVIRRSAYNLSLAATQATSTPIAGWPAQKSAQ